MKYRNIILTASLATALFVSACVEDIEYDGPDSKSMLVVNCITKDGDVPVFHLSRSRSFLDYYKSNDDFRSGINMEVSINGNARKAAYYDELGGYTDNRTISQGDVISVRAAHPDYGQITATDTVPYAQDMLMSSYIKKYVHAKTISEAFDNYSSDFDDSKVDSSLVVEIDIQGRPDADDFYILKLEPVAIYTQQWEFETEPDTIPMSLHFKVPAATKMLLGQSDATTAILEETEEDSQFEWGATSFVFSDQYIKDGSKLTFEILLERPDTTNNIYYYYNDEDIPVSPMSAEYSDTVQYRLDVKLYVLSSSYYYYHKSVIDYDNADMTFMSEPVTILHNVKGGAGILATYVSKEYSIGFTRRF